MDLRYARKVLTQVMVAYGTGLGKTSPEAHALAPMPSPTAPTFPGDYIAYNLQRKWDQLELGIDTKAAAIAAFDEAEAICFFVNRNNGVSRTTNRHKRRIGEAVIFHAIRKIGSMCSSLDVAELLKGCEHSNGASLQRKRRCSSKKNKWSDRNEVTRNAIGYWNVYREAACIEQSVTIVHASRGTTVSKDAKTDRPITIEPQGNMLLQKGVGSCIRKVLRDVGIDLNDQSRNRTLCANVENATIDLSSASDRISLSTVVLLLQQSPALLEAVLDLRTPNATFGDRTYLLQKCSGMGNGFTFELESLIFYAIAWASVFVAKLQGIDCKSTTVSVYGDDIIIPTQAAYILTTTLAYLGMSVNKSKSYADGPFRESCGAHYWNGTDVTPLYIKSSTFDNRGDWYHLCNGLNELLMRVYNERVHNILRGVVNRLKRKGWYLVVPPSYGVRTGLRASFDVAKPVTIPRSRRAHNSNAGFAINAWVPKTAVYKVCERGRYIAALDKSLQFRESDDAMSLVGPMKTGVGYVSCSITPVPAETIPVRGELFDKGEHLKQRVVSVTEWDDCYFVFWN